MIIDHISAGNLLAAFAMGIARDAREADDQSDTAVIAMNLADDWFRATDRVRDNPEQAAIEAIARNEGREQGRAEYDELLEIAVRLRHALGIGFAGVDLSPDVDIDDLEIRVSEAVDAASRLAVILIERDGQQSLELDP